MAGPDSGAPSSLLGKGEKFLITGQLPGSLGPLGTTHRGYLWEERGEEGLGPSPFQKELSSFKNCSLGLSRPGKGLEKETNSEWAGRENSA